MKISVVLRFNWGLLLAHLNDLCQKLEEIVGQEGIFAGDDLEQDKKAKQIRVNIPRDFWKFLMEMKNHFGISLPHHTPAELKERLRQSFQQLEDKHGGNDHLYLVLDSSDLPDVLGHLQALKERYLRKHPLLETLFPFLEARVLLYEEFPAPESRLLEHLPIGHTPFHPTDYDPFHVAPDELLNSQFFVLCTRACGNHAKITLRLSTPGFLPLPKVFGSTICDLVSAFDRTLRGGKDREFSVTRWNV